MSENRGINKQLFRQIYKLEYVQALKMLIYGHFS